MENPGKTFVCHNCGQFKVEQTSGGTGWVEYNGQKVCYECCADLDRKTMIEDGHSKRLPLYLTWEASGAWSITNWPGTLRFRTLTIPRQYRHNIAGVMYICYFVGPDGHFWIGRSYGNDTRIIHCKRTKEKA